MKIALVLPGSIWYAPYVRIYTRILDEEHVDYGIISWNREGDDKPDGFQYNVRCEKGHGSAGLSAYRGYLRFIKKTIREQGFDRIIVFGPQMTCLLSTFLLTKFRHRYMIDYRDLSIEQKPGVRQLFSIMLRYSCANVISSPGFKRCLPKRDYYLSHNFDVRAVREALENKSSCNTFSIENGIDILTIGAIRDYSSNIEVTKAIANQEGFTLRFVGRGQGTVERLQEYCDEVKAKNVSFVGAYDKSEEAGYVKACNFMNTFYPRIITHDTALSNRFYNSLIYRKPMIVTKDTIQGDYAEKYQVGVAIKDCNHLTEDLKSFLKQDYLEYSKRCDGLLRQFLEDQQQFEPAVVRFVKSYLGGKILCNSDECGSFSIYGRTAA